jgi:hypothetical protein
MTHVDCTQHIKTLLKCLIASFPQTYLGFPMSDSKHPKMGPVPFFTFSRQKDWYDSHLGCYLGGRLALTKSILSALPAHLLACIKAPRWFCQEINKRRCAYFWLGQNSMTGAKCKVAWDMVCRSIEEGGLNIENLEIQNICLLLKFIDKLHTPNKSSWTKWILSFIYSGQKRLGDKISRCSSSWHNLNTTTESHNRDGPEQRSKTRTARVSDLASRITN